MPHLLCGVFDLATPWTLVEWYLPLPVNPLALWTQPNYSQNRFTQIFFACIPLAIIIESVGGKKGLFYSQYLIDAILNVLPYWVHKVNPLSSVNIGGLNIFSVLFVLIHVIIEEVTPAQPRCPLCPGSKIGHLVMTSSLMVAWLFLGWMESSHMSNW